MPCPICKRPSRAETRPFCSHRCADLDLGRWLSGSYALPGPAADPDEIAAALASTEAANSGHADND